jgi:hypothetical protein
MQHLAGAAEMVAAFSSLNKPGLNFASAVPGTQTYSSAQLGR